jgi:hypothetical protein
MDVDKIKAALAAATPGPWGIGRHANTMIEAGERGRGIASSGGYQQNFDGERIRSENIANATLIAMAPDLAAEVVHLTAERDQLIAANQALMVRVVEIEQAAEDQRTADYRQWQEAEYRAWKAEASK